MQPDLVVLSFKQENLLPLQYTKKGGWIKEVLVILDTISCVKTQLLPRDIHTNAD